MNEELLIGPFSMSINPSNNISSPTPSSSATNPSPIPTILPTPITPSPAPKPGTQRPIPYKRLSPTELQAIRLALGAASPSDPSYLIHPTNILWLSSNIPPGLYHNILHFLTIAKLKYHLLAFVFNTLLVLQILLGASLTALSSISTSTSSSSSSSNIACTSTAAARSSFPFTYKSSIIITTLAAANTVVAGLIALLHNGGFPSEYKAAWKEFERVEMMVIEVLEVGLVREEWGVDEVVEWCFELFWEARRRVDGAVDANRGKNGVGEGGEGFD